MPRLGTWLLAIISLTSTVSASAQQRTWREGELTSRRTLRAQHGRIEYLYRLHSGDLWFRVESEDPLNVSLHMPVQFAIGRRHILIRDSNGAERKVLIVEKGNLGVHR